MQVLNAKSTENGNLKEVLLRNTTGDCSPFLFLTVHTFFKATGTCHHHIVLRLLFCTCIYIITTLSMLSEFICIALILVDDTHKILITQQPDGQRLYNCWVGSIFTAFTQFSWYLIRLSFLHLFRFAFISIYVRHYNHSW